MLKRIVFSCLTVVIFFIAIEAALRWLPFFHFREDLFVWNPSYSIYEVNRHFPDRFFFHPNHSSNITGDHFQRDKDSNEYRVAFLGASSTAGFPHSFNCSFPYFYRFILQNWFPDKKIKVLNLAASALSSYAVLDISKKLTVYHPDLVLLYFGHNEFYGNLGSANSAVFLNSYFFKKTYMFIKEMRLFALLKKILFLFLLEDRDESSLMETVYNKDPIIYESSLFQNTIDDFSKNLSLIIKQIHKMDVPLVIGTIISNKKDFYPFLSYHTNQDSMMIHQFNKKWKDYERTKKFTILEELLSLSPEHAGANFLYGKNTLELDNIERDRYLQKAYEHDGLRFRAPDQINIKIRNAEDKNNNIYICEIEKKLCELTNSNLLGNEFITEHLHPNVYGNWKIAELLAFFTVRDVLKKTEDFIPVDWDEAPYSVFDLMCAQKKIFFLTSRPPYHQQIKIYHEVLKNRDFDFLNYLSGEYLESKISWTQAHFLYADYLLKKKQVENSQKEIRILNDYYGGSSELLSAYGDSLFQENFFALSAKYYQEALNIEPQRVEAQVKYGMALYSDKKYPFALEVFMELINNEKFTKSVKTEKYVLLHRIIADCYQKIHMELESFKHIKIADSIEINYKNKQN